ncbi:MAG: D-alanyl-D-alanine carboxypeptidase, partial [Alphaproteobacteria bacterium]|nr:D-alanyl-D-alanine carboxypeptidase [Alphaproteobacteria bacterium]
LPNSKQKTTARDMATLAMAVYHHFPQYYSWFSVNSYKHRGQTITGHNHLLKTFSGADGMKTGYTAASGYNIITSAKRHNKRVIAVTMGHRYLNDRDKRAALMMDKGLTELKNNKTVNVASLKQAIDGTKTTQMAQAGSVRANNKKLVVNVASKAKRKPTTVAQATTQTSAMAKSGGGYGIQVGSFSDYKRAQNHASSIKNKLAQNYGAAKPEVEKVSVSQGSLYRSKVMGLTKQDAAQICQSMKKQKQSCLVVADNPSVKVARK